MAKIKHPIARIIRSEEEHHAALHELESLIEKDPSPSTSEGERLELLAVLIEEFEKRTFSFPSVDAVEAIEFRLQELGLRNKDLVPMIGSKSRVSEVLSRKRPLSLPMIRALHEGLAIPLEVLVSEAESIKSEIQHAAAEKVEEPSIDWKLFPIAEMKKRGYFDDLQVDSANSPENLVREFLSKVSDVSRTAPALFRRTLRGQGLDPKRHYATLAWTARLLIRASRDRKDVPSFDRTRLDANALGEIARLSTFEQGPILAIEYLREFGVRVIVEPALRGMLVDGAALLDGLGNPIIGLTMRYDRIDGFWFTLLHELIHVRDHLTSTREAFIDRVDFDGQTDEIETEANIRARDILIPRAHWRASEASASPNKASIVALAKAVQVHPAIVVGRVHAETKRFDRFRDMLGEGTLRSKLLDRRP